MAVTAIYDTGLATRLDRPTGTTVTAIGQAAIEKVTLGTTTVNGVLTPVVGEAVVSGTTAATVYHTGGVGANAGTVGTDTTPVNTETYIAEVEILHNATLTGISILNGSAVAGNVKLALANSAGVVVASTASTAQAGINAFQQIAFTAAYSAVGPAKFFVLAQFDTITTPKFRTHAVGNFGASKKTGEVYGTFTTVTPPTTFTTGQGPIADVY